jgi:hypothetical protein
MLTAPEEERMQPCRRHRTDLTILSAGMIAAMLGLTSPALPEDLQTLQAETDAYMKGLDADVKEYLQKHPVRYSLLMDSVWRMVETLGEVRVMALDQCEFAPFFQEWEDALPKLHANTVLALEVSFKTGMAKYRNFTPPEQAVIVDRSLCAEEKRHYLHIVRDLKGLGPALLKQGY